MARRSARPLREAPEELAAIRADTARWAPIVKASRFAAG